MVLSRLEDRHGLGYLPKPGREKREEKPCPISLAHGFLHT